MKRNKRWLVILIPVISGIVCLAWAGTILWQRTHFSCDSQLSIVGNKGREEIILHFRFEGKKGLVETRGKYTTAEGETIPTSNKVNFTFWWQDDALMMVSDETSRLPKIAPSTFSSVPDFFAARERGIRFQVIRRNADGYLFLFEETPTLYCAIAR